MDTNVNKPITNPELIELMKELKENPNPENENKFINCMINSLFLTPIIIDGEIEEKDDYKITIKKGTKINFKLIANKNTQKSYFLAFTDWDELRKWSNEPENAFIVNYDDLKNLVARSQGEQEGFVINPFNQNIIINSQIIERIQKHIKKVPIENN